MECKENLILSGNSPGNNIRIVTDYALWCCLFRIPSPKGARKLSKAEAFYDLITKQRQAILLYEQEYISAGFQTLADDWRWNRQTVKRFLKELQNIGSVIIDPSYNHTAIRVANVTVSDDAMLTYQSLNKDMTGKTDMMSEAPAGQPGSPEHRRMIRTTTNGSTKTTVST